jgi:hypothetical protein
MMGMVKIWLAPGTTGNRHGMLHPLSHARGWLGFISTFSLPKESTSIGSINA